MVIEKILIIDDEPLMRHFLQEALTSEGYVVEVAEKGRAGIAQLKKKAFDVVLTDLKMPDCSGIDVLMKAKELQPGALVIVMTAFGTIQNAVEAMQKGAFHYMLKPFTVDTLMALLKKGEEHLMLVHENLYLREQVAQKSGDNSLIIESPVMQKIMEQAVLVAKSDASVLIHGESGTGKEVIAAAIHRHSLRKEAPYIRVNCAAVPDALIESEFFGHEKGAFTGANSKRVGRFELADQGTLLLDEVTEIPLGLQPKLLRVIQEQEFERVGGSRVIDVDVRLISTSNRNLEEAIQSKIFREDLFYRLNVVPLYLPPLRERKEDILPLARYFLHHFSSKNQQSKKVLSKSAEKRLLAYTWPGNIRELSNLMERIVVLNEGTKVEAAACL